MCGQQPVNHRCCTIVHTDTVGNYVRFQQEIWYFVTKIVLTYCEKNLCSSVWEKLLKFEAEGQEFANFLRSLEQFIQTVKVVTECFFKLLPGGFSRSNTLEQLWFKLEKNTGI